MLDQILQNHDQRLDLIESSWPQLARTVTALAQEAEQPQWAQALATRDRKIAALESLIMILICAVIGVAGLSMLSIAYLSSRSGGVANGQSGPQ